MSHGAPTSAPGPDRSLRKTNKGPSSGTKRMERRGMLCSFLFFFGRFKRLNFSPWFFVFRDVRSLVSGLALFRPRCTEISHGHGRCDGVWPNVWRALIVTRSHAKTSGLVSLHLNEDFGALRHVGKRRSRCKPPLAAVDRLQPCGVARAGAGFAAGCTDPQRR